MPFGYDCVICGQRYETRSERNEHVETHFIHKNCSDCNRLVILIGDIEFELHRPNHCTSFAEPNDTQLCVAFKQETTISTYDIADINELRDDVAAEAYAEIEPFSITSNCGSNVSNEQQSDAVKSNTAQKRTRRKAIATKPKPKSEATKPKPPGQNKRPVKSFACSQNDCEETFRQQLLLRKHLKIAHGIVEKHTCHICSFPFSDKSNLKRHMVTHTDSHRFICSFCGAGFHKMMNLTEHMNGHLGVKPYRCEICAKEFGRSNHKRQHMRVIYD